MVENAKVIEDAIAKSEEVYADSIKKQQEEIAKIKAEMLKNGAKIVNTNDLDEFISKMSIDEMNTVLNMKAAGENNPEILEGIAKRLGVPVDKLEEIASKKEEILKAKENDVTSSSDNSSSNENEDKDNDKEKSETTPSSDSSSSDAAETGAEAIEPEECKKTTALKTAGEKLKNAIAKNKGKALAGLLAIAGIAALALVNPTMIFIALGIKSYKDFQAGAKGK